MNEKKFPFVKDLNQRKIGLDTKPPNGFKGDFAQPWVWEISSTEGIRWAHNTATNMIRYLIEMIPESEDEHRRRGLELETTYKRLEPIRDTAIRLLPPENIINENMRDQIWNEAGITDSGS